MTTFLMILQMLPVLLKAIKALEEEIPIGGVGKEKLDAILGIATDTVEGTEAVAKVLPAVIARIVALFKAVGVFKSQKA